MTYSEIYNDLLLKIRKEIPVYHRNLGDETQGFYDMEHDYIVISSGLKNTRKGVRALAHEYTHFMDNKAGKFPGFFVIYQKLDNKKVYKKVKERFFNLQKKVFEPSPFTLPHIQPHIQESLPSKQVQFSNCKFDH